MGQVENSVEHVHSASQKGNSVSEVPNGDALSSESGEKVCACWVRARVYVCVRVCVLGVCV